MNLKKSILRDIENADDRLLRLIKALMETYQQEEDNVEITDEQKKILDQRLADHKADPKSGKDWIELKSELRSKYGL